jgi:hypothetical protein
MSDFSPEFFLNVDLDIESTDDLAPLAHAFGARVFVLERPEGRASFELSEPVSPTEPDALIHEFVRMVNALPPATRGVWDRASKRTLDIGIQSGHGPPNQATYRLTPEALRAAADIGAEIAITVYALSPEKPTPARA